MNLHSTLELPHRLASFNNLELYCIVSKLFGLGGFGEHFIEKERLYICPSKEHYIKFFFVTTIPVVSEQQTTPSTTIYYGQFDEDFEDIEIYGGEVPFETYSADKTYFNDGTGLSQILKDEERIHIKPVLLVEGLLAITSQSKIRTREPNPLFDLTKNEKLAKKYFQDFTLFAKLDRDLNEYREFSGRYYLIAEPVSAFQDTTQKIGTIVHQYSFDQAGKVKVKGSVIDAMKMSDIESKFSCFDIEQLKK